MIRINENRGVSLNLIICISRQLLKCIGLLHDLRLNHTDLRPENILFSRVRQLQKWQNDMYLSTDHKIKVIDLGGAEFDDELKQFYNKIHQYRAVHFKFVNEISKRDVWEIACIIFEICIGNESRHMAWLRRQQNRIFLIYWRANGVKQGLKHFFNKKNVTNREYDIQPQGKTKKDSIHNLNYKTLSEMILEPLLEDLLCKMLEIYPKKRITCYLALNQQILLQLI